MIPDCGPLTEVVLIRYMCCCYYCIVYDLQTPPDWKWPTQWRGWHLKQYPASNPAAVSDQSRLLALPLKQMASMVKMPGIARAWQDIWPTDYARNHTGSRTQCSVSGLLFDHHGRKGALFCWRIQSVTQGIHSRAQKEGK